MGKKALKRKKKKATQSRRCRKHPYSVHAFVTLQLLSPNTSYGNCCLYTGCSICKMCDMFLVKRNTRNLRLSCPLNARCIYTMLLHTTVISIGMLQWHCARSSTEHMHSNIIILYDTFVLCVNIH